MSLRFSASLQTRIAAAATLVFVVVTATGGWLMERRMRANAYAEVSQRLGRYVGRLSSQVDDNISHLREILANEAEAARNIPPPHDYDLFGRQRSSLNFNFDYGVLLIEPSGNVAADSMNRVFMQEADFSRHEFFQRAFALGKPVISQPFAAPDEEGTPIVVFAHPLRDDDGGVSTLLAGCLDLINNRLLAQPTGLTISRYGQIGVFTRDGLVVAHTDKNLILDSFENPVHSPIEGGDSELLQEIEISPGVPAILAARALDSAEWMLAGTFPVREAFDPIDAAFARARVWLAAGILACCLGVWLVTRRLTRGLVALANEVRDIGGDPDETHKRVAARGGDEVGTLAASIHTMLAALETARDEIGFLSARLSEAEEKERRRIAAGLHDSVSQTLALANMRLGAIRRKLPDGDREVAARIDEIRRDLEESVRELRTLIFDLSPTILYELGLAAALEWYAGEFSEKYGIACSARDHSVGEKIDQATEILLFRAAREALANAAKHARAKNVFITLIANVGEAGVIVEDDGVGMVVSTPRGGFGLRNLAEQARRTKGRFHIENRSSGGLRVEFFAPCGPKRRDNETGEDDFVDDLSDKERP